MYHNLFVNYYQDKNAERTAELNFCIIENLKNPYLDSLVVICTASDWQKLYELISVYEDVAVQRGGLKIKKDSLAKKVISVLTDVRPTFNDYFRLIKKTFPSDENINMIANLDIIIPSETLHNPNGKTVKDYLTSKEKCMALCRWDVTKADDYKAYAKFLNHIDSQDIWIFVGGVNEIEKADYGLGIAGIDNYMANLLEVNGYEVLSPSLTLKTFHFHLTEVRNYTALMPDGDIFRLPPPFKLLTPTF